MKRTNKFTTKDIALAGVFMAVVLLASFIPQIGFVQLFPNVGFTTIHAIVIIYIIAVKGDLLKSGLMGLIFGFGSFIVAIMRATWPIELLFQNPLVSVLPRIAFAIVCALLVKMALSKFKTNKTRTVAIATAAVLATIAHTALVLGTIWLFDNSLLPWSLVWIIISTNAVFEVILAALLASSMYQIVRRIS